MAGEAERQYRSANSTPGFVTVWQSSPDAREELLACPACGRSLGHVVEGTSGEILCVHCQTLYRVVWQRGQPLEVLMLHRRIVIEGKPEMAQILRGAKPIRLYGRVVFAIIQFVLLFLLLLLLVLRF